LQTTYFGICATLGFSFILKHDVIVYMSSLHENASKMTRHSCPTLGTFIKA